EMRRKDRPAEPEFGFKYYAHRYVEKAKRQAARGERNASYVRTATVALDNDDWGLVRHFATRDVRELKTRDWQLFIEKIAARRPDLSSSTRNTLMTAFRNVMKVVRDDGVIDVDRIRRASPAEIIPAPSFAFIRWSRRPTTNTKSCSPAPKASQKKAPSSVAFLLLKSCMTSSCLRCTRSCGR